MSNTRTYRNQPKQVRTNYRLFSLLFVVVALTLGFFYVFMLSTSGDPFWFRSSFDAQPSRLIIVDRGRETIIPSDDARFAPLVDALNRSISGGYYSASIGFGAPTWELVDKNGLTVTAEYPRPVKLYGDYAPSQRLMVIVGGQGIHTTEIMFWWQDAARDQIPVRIKDIAPLRQMLANQGFVAQ